MNPKTTTRIAVIASALALVLAACGGSDDSDSSAETSTAVTSTQTEPEPTATEPASTEPLSADPPTDTSTPATEVPATSEAATVERFVADTSECTDDLTTGITDTEIKIGTSAPQSGPLALIGQIPLGTKAYFDYVNAELGGVNGRTLSLEIKDDAYDPGRTVTNVQELVDQDQVFALLSSVGTPNNLAVWDDLNERCVPQLYVATGAPQWGDIEGHPWTIGALPSYSTEAEAYVRDMAARFPDGADIALLWINNDFGKAYVEGFNAAVEGTNLNIVSDQSIEPTDTSVQSQITTLAASGATVLLNMTSGAFCPQTMVAVSQSGWDPTMYQSMTCAVAGTFFAPVDPAGDGVVTASFVKDPTDPQWADDPDMQEYLAKMAQYAPDVDPNGLAAYGWMIGDLFVKTLEQAGDDPTRASVLEAARNLEQVQPWLVLPDASLSTGPDDAYPVEALQIMHYDASTKSFVFDGPLQDLEGQTRPYSG